MNWKAPYQWLRKKAGLNPQGIRHNEMSACLNCGKGLEEADLYCKHCGQKVHISKLTIGMLVTEFFAGLFNIENGFYKSLSRVFYPGFLSKEFIKGRRKQYLNPIRFFLIAFFIYLAIVNFVINLDLLVSGSNSTIEDIGKSELYDYFYNIRDSLQSTYSISGAQMDSVEASLFRKVKRTEEDTIGINGKFLSIDISKYNFSRSDMYDMPIDSIMTKYKIEGFYEKLIASQIIRTTRDPAGAMRFLIGNIIWCVTLTILFLSFLLKFLYVRRKRFFVEHFIVLCHVHVFAFLVASTALIIHHYSSQNQFSWLIPVTSALIIGHFFLTIKNYYGQGWFKSIFKFSVIGMAYIFILSLVAAATIIVSLALFK